MDETTNKKLEKIKGTAWAFFIERRPIAWIALAAIIIFGAVSWTSMQREIQPEINIPYGVVVTALPGANPTDVESLITAPLEKEVASINNIETLSSTSGFGASSIFIEFTMESDMDENMTNLRDAVNRGKSELPDDATDPSIAKAEANDYVVIGYSINGEQYSLYELTQIGEDIQDALESIPDVSRVDVLGGQDKIIEVEINQEKLEGYGLDISTIANLIDLANNNLPIGIVSSDQLNYSIRVDNRYNTIQDLQKLPIATLSDSTTIQLQDIAKVEEALPVQNVISKFSINGKESLQTVSLQVYKKQSADITETVEAVKEKMEEIEVNIIPEDVNLGISTDLSVYVTESLNILTETGLQTTVLIAAILFLALGLRQGLIAGLSVPIIFLVAFIVMEIQGLTLNSLSLFSLVIALGLIVDTTIVIMEGVFDGLKQGLSAKESALVSVYTYKWPVIAGTLTTVFVFFPMLLVSGILGEFLKTLPITISAALIGSLFVSLTIAPAMATKFAKKKEGSSHISILEPIFNKIGEKFKKIVTHMISSKRTRYAIIGTAVILFLASLSFPATGMLPVEMFPITDQYTFVINIETPKGTILEETKKVTEEIETYLYDIPEIDNFVTNIGTNQTAAGFSENIVSLGATSDSNISNITVNLINKEDRERESMEIAKEVREKLAGFNTAEITITEFQEGTPSEADITARITGTDLETLKQIADEVEAIFTEAQGTLNIEKSLESGLNEFKFTLDPDKLSYHGLQGLAVSATIRNIIQGIDATDIKIDGEDTSVVVKYDLPKTDGHTNISINDIENFAIQTPAGYSVTLGEIGEYEFGESLASISREDQDKIVKVLGDVTEGTNVVEVTEAIQEKTNKLDLPSGYEITFGGDLEQIAESFQDLFKSMIIGIILVAFTLVLMFNSFRQALIILITIPLSMIGVLPGLYLIGLDLSFPAFLGIVALAGIVVNDAIVLMDRINSNRAEGKPFTESIAEAAESRLQPIMMTSITTIVGILPLAITDKFWQGLGFSMIFGLIASTFLTLLVIPSLYFRFEKKKAKQEGAYDY